MMIKIRISGKYFCAIFCAAKLSLMDPIYNINAQFRIFIIIYTSHILLDLQHAQPTLLLVFSRMHSS